MNCKDIQAKLIDYLDAKVDAATAEEMRQHLASCASCTREAEELRELLTAMSVGVAAGTVAYFAGPWLAAGVSAVGGFATTLAVHAGLWFRRVLSRPVPAQL